MTARLALAVALVVDVAAPAGADVVATAASPDGRLTVTVVASGAKWR